MCDGQNAKSNIIRKPSFEAGNKENLQGLVWGQLIVIRRRNRKFDLSKAEFTVGRENCDINLTTDDMAVEHLPYISRVHFKLWRCEATNSPVYLEDMSRNGTFINGEKVGYGNKQILQNEDIIAIGSDFRKIFRFFDRFASRNNNIPDIIKKDYYISHKLGTGACGIVSLVFNKRTCEKYAMKQIAKSKSNDNNKLNNRSRIMNEINIMKKLNHPFIVKVFNIIEAPEAVFLILELMNGGDLYTKITQSRFLKESITKNILYQVAVAVNYLHKQNVTHRDLKPENILLQTNGDNPVVKLADFGLSKFVDDGTVLKTECGTALYVAPEVILKNFKTYTDKVDVWSLGVILFVCLSGSVPFSDNNTSLADQICKGKYSFKQRIWSSISEQCKDLISKMLTVDPQVRLSSSEVLEHKWLQDAEVIERYSIFLSQENSRQEITVSDLEESLHYNNTCPENCLDISEPPAKRHCSLLIF